MIQPGILNEILNIKDYNNKSESEMLILFSSVFAFVKLLTLLNQKQYDLSTLIFIFCITLVHLVALPKAK